MHDMNISVTLINLYIFGNYQLDEKIFSERMKIYENIWIRDDISDSKHIISNSASGLQLHFFVYIQLSSIPQWIFRQYQVSI